MEDYEGSFYPTVSNIDGRDEFERLLRGDVMLPGIGRTQSCNA
jgi:hypothetical protein